MLGKLSKLFVAMDRRGLLTDGVLIVFGVSTMVHRSMGVWAMICSCSGFSMEMYVALESSSFVSPPPPFSQWGAVQTFCLVRVWGSAKANPLPFSAAPLGLLE